MPASCFVFLDRFRREPAWNSFAPWTLLMAILLSATLALFIFATNLPVGQSLFHGWFGLIQRLVLIPYMLWIFTFALAFYKRL
jgi:membrane-bound acyltransferase YfiQ involved in biofilm formation